MSSKVVNANSISSCVNSGCRSALRSSSRKHLQRKGYETEGENMMSVTYLKQPSDSHNSKGKSRKKLAPNFDEINHTTCH